MIGLILVLLHNSALHRRSAHRQVPQADARLKEAAKLGFERGFMPPVRNKGTVPSSLSVSQPETLSEFIDMLGGIV